MLHYDILSLFKEDSFISKGLAIDLLHLSSEKGLPDIVLARWGLTFFLG